ncbi:hypothetical protein TRAPUB_1460 [Trametes pubescens]|uniref:DUF6699 domain-containing protein n=1 Tax=Trametes pubescens TaxID=154538 RepID=A0A1M2VJ83_TRAPU|nr:hypothetical protein TRAPUB_1460 [Trametes pubescens]
MNWHLLPQAAYPPIRGFMYPPPGAPSLTWSGSTSTSPDPGTPQLPPTPLLPTVPLPSHGNYEDYGWHTRIPPMPSTAVQRGPRAPAVHWHAQPDVDPLIAYTPRVSAAHASSAWNLLCDPRVVQFTDSRWCALSRAQLTARCAVWGAPQDGGRPLRSLVLIFRGLPLQIKIPPSGVFSHINRRGPADFVSIWDVLAGLHNELHAPVDRALFAGLPGPDKKRALRRSADRPEPVLAEGRQQVQGHLLRNIDLLAGRRFFGVRVATDGEVPWDRHFGEPEVFVVEVGSG